MSIPIAFAGNLTNDPELRFTPTGAAVATFTVAVSQRVKQGDSWVDGEPTFMRCSVWRQYAENVTETLSKGTRVVVTGKLKQRTYEDKAGEKRTVTEVEVEEVGPALRYATAKVNRVERGKAGQMEYQAARSNMTDDPWTVKPDLDEVPF